MTKFSTSPMAVNINITIIEFFFFSSRRRHTRYWRDWSSDVCSSDLKRKLHGHGKFAHKTGRPLSRLGRERTWFVRSEERRVGKECRSRRSQYHIKKNKERQKQTNGSKQTYHNYRTQHPAYETKYSLP